MADTADHELTETERLIKRNKSNGWKDLKAKEKAFCLEYVFTYHVADSAKVAKLKPAEANRLLRNPIATAYISHLQTENAISNFVTKDFVRTQYLNLIPKLSGEEQVALIHNASGESFQDYKFHPGELISVLKELNKMSDDYEGEKLNIGGDLTEVFRKAMMSNG